LVLKGNKVGGVVGWKIQSGLGKMELVCMRGVKVVEGEPILDALKLFGYHGEDGELLGRCVPDEVESCRFPFLSEIGGDSLRIEFLREPSRCP
jgi:hypothetical protein